MEYYVDDDISDRYNFGMYWVALFEFHIYVTMHLWLRRATMTGWSFQQLTGLNEALSGQDSYSRRQRQFWEPY